MNKEDRVVAKEVDNLLADVKFVLPLLVGPSELGTESIEHVEHEGGLHKDVEESNYAPDVQNSITVLRNLVIDVGILLRKQIEAEPSRRMASVGVKYLLFPS